MREPPAPARGTRPPGECRTGPGRRPARTDRRTAGAAAGGGPASHTWRSPGRPSPPSEHCSPAPAPAAQAPCAGSVTDPGCCRRLGRSAQWVDLASSGCAVLVARGLAQCEAQDAARHDEAGDPRTERAGTLAGIHTAEPGGDLVDHLPFHHLLHQAGDGLILGAPDPQGAAAGRAAAGADATRHEGPARAAVRERGGEGCGRGRPRRLPPAGRVLLPGRHLPHESHRAAVGRPRCSASRPPRRAG